MMAPVLDEMDHLPILKGVAAWALGALASAGSLGALFTLRRRLDVRWTIIGFVGAPLLLGALAFARLLFVAAHLRL